MFTKKKQVFVISSLAFITTICVGSTVLANGTILNNALGNNSTYVFNHYSAVSPTFDSHGSKEYWISCNEPDNPIHTTKPTEFKEIVDKGTPSEEFVASLEIGDTRYAERYHKAMSFEDGKIPDVLSFNSGSGVVSDEAASLGTKSLKIVGNFKLQFSQDFLDKFNALYDSDDCILFDIKASAQCKNLYYSSTTESYGVHRYDSVNNIGNDAVTTNWKTFAFKKSFLSSLKDREVIRVDNSNGATIYIDNIRIGKPYTRAEYLSFEDNSIYNNKVIRLDSWAEELQVIAESSATCNIEISSAYASEGHNSLHVTTPSAAKVNCFINKDMYDATEVGFLFDLYTPEGAPITNIKNRYKSEGGNVYYTPQNFTAAGKWITFFVPKSAVYDNDYMLFRCDNSIVNDFYIDNIRLANANIDFEHGDVTTFNTSRYAYASNYSGNYVNADLGAKNGTDIWYQGNFNVSLSEERSTNGAYSFKAEATATNSGLYISDKLYQQLGEGGLKMDMYATQKVDFKSLVSGESGLSDSEPGKWISLIVPKRYIGKNPSNEWCLFVYGDLTTTYIDNIQVLTDAESINSDLIGDSTYDWYE